MNRLPNGNAPVASVLPNARVEDLLAATDDCVIVLDKAWRFVFVNARADEELGAGPLLGSVIWNSFPETVGSDFELRYRRAAKTGTPQTFEAFFPPLTSWYEVRAVPFLTRLVVFFRNITERHISAERAARDSAEHDRHHIANVTMASTPISALVHKIIEQLTAAGNYSIAAKLLLEGSTEPNAKLARDSVAKAASETVRAAKIVHRLRRMVKTP